MDVALGKYLIVLRENKSREILATTKNGLILANLSKSCKADKAKRHLVAILVRKYRERIVTSKAFRIYLTADQLAALMRNSHIGRRHQRLTNRIFASTISASIDQSSSILKQSINTSLFDSNARIMGFQSTELIKDKKPGSDDDGNFDRNDMEITQ